MDDRVTIVTQSIQQEGAVDADPIRLAWGNAARWKARWRTESAAQHQQQPVGVRLRDALSLVLKRSER